MKRLRSSGGFTLVELIITMAIAALLLVGFFVARGQFSIDSQFTGAMDQAKNSLRSIQNEAAHALSTTTGTTGQSKNVIFGKLVQFQPAAAGDPNVVKVFTLVGRSDGGQNVTSLTACADADTKLGNGVQYTGSASRSVIFARNTKQLFVAPDSATMTPLGGPSCASGDFDATVPTGPAESCPGGTIIRTPADPVGTCSLVAASPPVVTVRNIASGASVVSTSPSPTLTMLTPTFSVDVAVTDPNAPISVSIIRSDGSLVGNYTITSGSTAVSGKYHAVLNPDVTVAFGTYTVTSSWVKGSSTPVTVQYTVPTTCTSPLSISAGYQCGLKGEYYRGLLWDAGGTVPAQTIAIDTQIGTNLGGSESSYSDFLPTLRKRTNQPMAQFATVKWTGQMYLDSVRNVCVGAADPATLTLRRGPVTASATTIVNPQTKCANGVGDAASPGWWDIEVTYQATDDQTEGPASIQLLQQFGSGARTEVPGGILRVSNTVHASGPPPYIQGLNAYYYKGDMYGRAGAGTSYQEQPAERVNGIGTASTPQTYPDYFDLIKAKTGAPANVYLGAYWRGYFHETNLSGSTYRFCTDADDTSGIMWYDYYATNPPGTGGRWLVDDHLVPGHGTGGPLLCSQYFVVPYGDHPLYIQNQDTCKCDVTNLTAIKLLYQKFGDPVPTEVPLNRFSTAAYSTTYGTIETDFTTDYQGVVATLQKYGPSQSVMPPVSKGKPKSLVGELAQSLKTFFVGDAAAVVVCDDNILNPFNYQGTCTDFNDDLDVPVQLSGDTTRTATIRFDHDANTISWVPGP